MNSEISLILLEAPDIRDGVIHLDHADMRQLGVVPGDVIPVEGARRIYLFVEMALIGDHNQRLARVSSLTAKNLGGLSGQKVTLYADRTRPSVAELVVFETEDDVDLLHVQARQDQIAYAWNRRVVVLEDELALPVLDTYPLLVKMRGVQPSGPVQIVHATEFSAAQTKNTYPHLIRIGGLREPFKTCQILASKKFGKGHRGDVHSILLHGPTGCGKSRLVARIAQQMGAELHVLDAQQLLDQASVHGGLELGGLLSDLAHRGKVVLLVDNLDALYEGFPEDGGRARPLSIAAHAVMVQLAALLQEVATQSGVLLFGISSYAVDKHFSSLNQFDVTVPVDPPNRWGRMEILLLATENVPLADDVDLGYFAAMSTGMTARDLVKAVQRAKLLSQGQKISQKDLIATFRHVVPSVARDVSCDVPTVLWDEVAGLDEIKQLLSETLTWSISQFDKFKSAGVRPPRSILLSGGQGTGKTSLVRGLASHMPMHFIEISCPLLRARPRDEAFRYLRDSFVLARRRTPCLIFLDDLDVLFDGEYGEETTSSSYYVVAQLISQMDDLALTQGVVVIAATNRPDRLDPDILKVGRFDFAVTLPMPDLTARRTVLQIHARKLPLAADVDFDQLAVDTQGMSSMEIANLCNRVGLMALRQYLNDRKSAVGMPVVSSEHFQQVLRGRKN